MVETIASTAFTRGETFTVVLAVRSGDLSAATARVVIKRAPGDSNAVLGELTPVWTDHIDSADDTSDPGWNCTLSATDSEAMPLGTFVMDARIVNGSTVIQTSAVAVTVSERVTPGA